MTQHTPPHPVPDSQPQAGGSQYPASRSPEPGVPREPQQERPRLPVWARALLALVAFMADIPFVLALMYGTPLGEAFTSSDPLLRMEAQILVWSVPLPLYLLFTFLLTRYVDRRPMRVTGLTLNRRALLGLLTGTGISVAVVGGLTAVFFFLGSGIRAPEEAWSGSAMLPVWLVVVHTIVFCYVYQGIGEEAVMRDYLLQSLSDHPKRAVWISAIVFTIPHLLSSGGQQNALDHVLYLVETFGFALAAAYLALMMRSTWAAIGIHGGLHLGRRLMPIVTGVDLPNGRLVWIASGLVFCAIAALLASRISKQRWTEIAARGPYAPPL